MRPHSSPQKRSQRIVPGPSVPVSTSLFHKQTPRQRRCPQELRAKNRVVEVKKALEWARQLSQGLEYIHGQKVKIF